MKPRLLTYLIALLVSQVASAQNSLSYAHLNHENPLSRVENAIAMESGLLIHESNSGGYMESLEFWNNDFSEKTTIAGHPFHFFQTFLKLENDNAWTAVMYQIIDYDILLPYVIIHKGEGNQLIQSDTTNVINEEHFYDMQSIILDDEDNIYYLLRLYGIGFVVRKVGDPNFSFNVDGDFAKLIANKAGETFIYGDMGLIKFDKVGSQEVIFDDTSFEMMGYDYFSDSFATFDGDLAKIYEGAFSVEKFSAAPAIFNPMLKSITTDGESVFMLGQNLSSIGVEGETLEAELIDKDFFGESVSHSLNGIFIAGKIGESLAHSFVGQAAFGDAVIPNYPSFKLEDAKITNIERDTVNSTYVEYYMDTVYYCNNSYTITLEILNNGETEIRNLDAYGAQIFNIWSNQQDNFKCSLPEGEIIGVGERITLTAEQSTFHSQCDFDLSTIQYFCHGANYLPDCFQNDNSIYPSVILSVFDKLNTKEFYIAPNPTTNFIRLTSDETIKNFELFSSSGQRVHSEYLNYKEGNIDLSSMTSGVYFARLTFENGYGTKLIVIN